MKVMVFVKATDDSERGLVMDAETRKMMQEMGKFNDALTEAGVLVTGEGLKPTSEGKRVAFEGTGRTVSNGPFKPSRDQVAGFWIWEVKDMNEAIEWVKKCPNPMKGPSEIEVRPFYEEKDFK